MALKACSECGNQVSTAAAACPKCGAKLPHGIQLGRLVLGGLVGVGVYYAYMSFVDMQVADQMQKGHNQLATDWVTQYEIAKRQGDAMQICSQAGLVSLAFLNAKDEINYRKWKTVQDADCEHADAVRMGKE